MRKIYLPLRKEEKENDIVFSSTLSKYKFVIEGDTTHEVKGDDPEREKIIERLKNDKFFNNSHFNYNIIRQ